LQLDLYRVQGCLFDKTIDSLLNIIHLSDLLGSLAALVYHPGGIWHNFQSAR
jgi:hypothetical protein